jgi:hypothetical protein
MIDRCEMKRATPLVILAIILLSGLIANAQSSQPSRWNLTVTSGGAPWEKRFTVEFDQTGLLSATEEEPLKRPNDSVTKLTANLSKKDVQAIYLQALRAIFAPRPIRSYEIADGTVIHVKLTADGRASLRGYHVGLTEEEAPEAAKLFGLINKHLPKEHHIY